ncbi:MAG: hypothetical protein P0S95_04720 [Rhabdochlamydiaceae bacterium]|nr:hypothetical protein [Candidatus Amphrikana amoebophyrae]
MNIMLPQPFPRGMVYHRLAGTFVQVNPLFLHIQRDTIVQLALQSLRQFIPHRQSPIFSRAVYPCPLRYQRRRAI